MRKLLAFCVIAIIFSVILSVYFYTRPARVRMGETFQLKNTVNKEDIGANMTISPSSPGIIAGSLGNKLTLLVNIQPKLKLSKIHLILQFDNESLELEDIERGSYFEKSEEVVKIIDNEKGELIYEIVMDESINSGGVLLELDFLTKKKNTSASISIKSGTFVLTDQNEKRVVPIGDPTLFTIE